ncbi:patatin-like phospholipase family protein [Pseudonocardia sp. ICBG601]|uniref:patatin-like phospholipase family protein n=1 Tax=Pseudonocardia sp. ICBG601 TaxID=2846759 RepID=UPI001CF62B90|nr:patatin-like phospholipase family protein [Pseudonocardia sp. ICBG601]
MRRRDTGRRDDGHRIALVIASGGMRGAYAGGMAHAIDDAGLAGGFDAVYGSSAGAYIGVALIHAGGANAARIFFEDMACRDFIDPRRLCGRGSMVSLDHLVDRILVDSKPMPWDRIRDSTVALNVVATAVDDLSGHVLEPRTISDWKLAMRATSSIPLLAGGPVRLHDRSWIDGAVSEPLPLLRALRDGSTHVLALINLSVPELRRIPADPPSPLWARGLNRLVPGLGDIAQSESGLGPVRAVLEQADHPHRRHAHLLTVGPEADAGVGPLTIDPVKVRTATEIGYAAFTAALDRAVERAQPI